MPENTNSHQILKHKACHEGTAVLVWGRWWAVSSKTQEHPRTPVSTFPELAFWSHILPLLTPLSLMLPFCSEPAPHNLQGLPSSPESEVIEISLSTCETH